MRSITRLFGAVGTLADSLMALASVVNTATDKLRLQLSAETDPAAILEHQPAGNAEEQAEPTPSTKRGRKVS